MNVRSSLKTGKIPAALAGFLLFTLAGASLGCAYAACYGVADVPPPALASPGPGHTHVPAAAPTVQPMAGVQEHGGCPGAASVRTRRAVCRAADLPAV